MVDAGLWLVTLRASAACGHHVIAFELAFPARLAGLEFSIPAVGRVESTALVRLP